MKQSILLLSTGRTGTMFFASLLRAHVPHAAVYHEAGERSRLINILTNAHLAGLLPFSAPRWAWRRVVQADLERCDQDYYIDSNNQLYAFAVLAPQLYPGLKVIHIVRDARSYVTSHVNWARHRVKSTVANYLTPFWQPSGWLMGQMSLAAWLHLSSFEKFAWIWDFKNRFMGRLEGSDTPYLRVRFEDFFGHPDPLDALNRMLDFLELERVPVMNEAFQHPVNPAVKQSFPAWPQWTPGQCARLSVLCGEMMAAYGYGNEEAWRQKVLSGLNPAAGSARSG